MDNSYIIDTSSLLSFVRYYLPFDKKRKLYDFLENKFESGTFILLESVKKQIEVVAQKIVIDKCEFLKKLRTEKNIEVIEPKMHKIIDNNWCHRGQIKNIKNDNGYEEEKKKLIKDADCQLILYALQDKKSRTIVTEETRSANDNKLFKKISSICEIEGIDCVNLPMLLKNLRLVIEYDFK